MKIVIMGAGDVGSHLAKLLSREAQDIVLVDPDRNKLDPLDSNYNLMTLVGSPTSFEALRSARVPNCDLYIAVTPYETTNIISCEIAKNLGAKTTVARVDNYEFMQPKHVEVFNALGVDHLIYPEMFAAAETLSALRRSWARNWLELNDGEIMVVGVKVRDDAPIVGQLIKDLAIQQALHISAIKRRHETIIPRGDDRIKSGDILFFTTTKDHVDEVREVCGKTLHQIKKVMIMGGSRIAVRIAVMGADEFKFKIIEQDSNRCLWLADRCPDAEIIHGDGRDNELLIEEGIEDQDAFIALTDSSETNILACLTAKEFGVEKTVAEVENIQLISEAEGLNIGTVINKKLLASSKIFQLMLAADSETSKCLTLADAEVATLTANPGSKITKGRIRDLNLTRDMTIAGAVRNGNGMLVTGNTIIEPGDQVVVFCLAGSIHKIERLFS
ncbi:MAG: Trk system potassium transporter TrkA [Muribaculaceae bacterium]|nr:Trk system potassium transporter TrkA [Muribaculaceae bacterium]MDE6320797.1 Trk system potassium transporter TrkA [Muribaculaceae bacterium]